MLNKPLLKVKVQWYFQLEGNKNSHVYTDEFTVEKDYHRNDWNMNDVCHAVTQMINARYYVYERDVYGSIILGIWNAETREELEWYGKKLSERRASL
jgi:hypothetical protein